MNQIWGISDSRARFPLRGGSLGARSDHTEPTRGSAVDDRRARSQRRGRRGLQQEQGMQDRGFWREAHRHEQRAPLATQMATTALQRALIAIQIADHIIQMAVRR